MSAKTPQLPELESLSYDGPRVLRSIGPANKPFIMDTERTRCLHFDFASIQSAMRLDDPHRLCLAYTRKMMAFLLFNATPGRLLLLGLGGGSLAKFCFRRLRSTAITAVEIDPDVIALREEFRIPPDDRRFRVIQAEAAQYVSRLARRKDVILADACDARGVAPQLNSVEFYQCVWESLSNRGIFVTNLCGEVCCRASHLAKIRQVFGEPLLLLPVRRGQNLIVIVSKARDQDGEDAKFDALAVDLKRRFGLEFPRFVRQIRSNARLRRQRHSPP
jgi:spermidine synthase